VGATATLGRQSTGTVCCILDRAPSNLCKQRYPSPQPLRHHIAFAFASASRSSSAANLQAIGPFAIHPYPFTHLSTHSLTHPSGHPSNPPIHLFIQASQPRVLFNAYSIHPRRSDSLNCLPGLALSLLTLPYPPTLLRSNRPTTLISTAPRTPALRVVRARLPAQSPFEFEPPKVRRHGKYRPPYHHTYFQLLAPPKAPKALLQLRATRRPPVHNSNPIKAGSVRQTSVLLPSKKPLAVEGELARLSHVETELIA